MGKESKPAYIEQWARMIVAVAAASLIVAGALRDWWGLPKRVEANEAAVEQLPVIRTQVAWLVGVVSKAYKVEPPDLSQFEPHRRRRAP